MDESTKELLSRAVRSFRDGDFKSAEESFLGALKAEPDSALVCNNYAMLLKKVERFEEAEEHFRKALMLEPSNVQIQKNYGSLLKAKNNAKSEKTRAPGNIKPL